MDEHEQQQQCLMEQRLNLLTGDAEWVVVPAACGDEDGVEKWSLAHTQYLDMLNDAPRNRAYDLAIRKTVKAGDRVLDVGAGTGLLSMMAWRAMAAVENPSLPVDCDDDGRASFPASFGASSPRMTPDCEDYDPASSRASSLKVAADCDGDDTVSRAFRLRIPGHRPDDDHPSSGPSSPRITACESYLPMVTLARRVFRKNGVGSAIRLVHKRSDEMEIGADLPCPVDVLVSEILDSELLGEGLIPTLRHAHAHLLRPGGHSVPSRATVFGQLVECDYLWRCQDLAGVEAEIGDGLLLAGGEAGVICGSAGTMHADALVGELSLLSMPFEVFSFDFGRAPAERREREIEVPIIKAGRVHALVSWWVLELDAEATVVYSTAPQWAGRSGADGSCWKDHWKQCVWCFPGSGLQCLLGVVVTVRACHDEIRVKYAIRSVGEVEKRQVGGRDVDGNCTGDGSVGYHSVLVTRPERIACLGDERYRKVIREAVMQALQGGASPLCLVVDDSVLCTLTAALVHSNSDVVAMLPGLQHDASAALKSMAQANAVSRDRIQVVGKKAAQLSAGDLKGRKVDVVIAEPYYRGYEDFLPWRHLRFWYERTTLAPLLVDHPTIIPCKGVLRGVAVFLPDLWHSREGLAKVEGFDLSQVNAALGACGELPSLLEGPLLPYSVWQCGLCKELTDPFSIMTFDFSLPLQAVEGSVTVPVSSSGLCHGLVLWMDWIMISEADLVLSTGPTGSESKYWKQGAKLLSCPVRLAVRKEPGTTKKLPQKQFSKIRISAVFSPSSGNVEVNLTTIPS